MGLFSGLWEGGVMFYGFCVRNEWRELEIYLKTGFMIGHQEDCQIFKIVKLAN